jgi:hypothetical protein
MERATREFVPNICKPTKKKDAEGNETEVAPAYSGSVTIMIPNYDERLDIMISIEESGGKADATATRVEKYKYYQAVARHLPKFVKTIDIVRLEDELKFDSLDSLQADTEMGGLITELAGVLVQAYSAGKKT